MRVCAGRLTASWIALAVALAGCARPANTGDAPVLVTPAPYAALEPPAPAACQASDDGAPPSVARAPQLAERGIGGTGSPSAGAIQTAERGIGGTGIIGVITGFASVCLNGREVAFDPAVPVSIDGVPAQPGALRAGQVAAVTAQGASDMLSARSIAIRHEVSGPIDRVGPGPTLRVAGQEVVLAADTWRARRTPDRVGDWVAVSGLRTAGGTIAASRIDPRAPGTVLVHGPVAVENGQARIGALLLAPGLGMAGRGGQAVTVSGQLVAVPGLPGQPQAMMLAPDTVEIDQLATAPELYFDPSVTTLLVVGYYGAVDGRFRFGLERPRGLLFRGGYGVLELSRDPGGRFSPGGPPGSRAPRGAGFEPAPGTRDHGGLRDGPRGLDRPGARPSEDGVPRRGRFGPDRGDAAPGPGFGGGPPR